VTGAGRSLRGDVAGGPGGHGERRHPGTVLLTRLGGGAFGNDDRWIDDAIERALERVAYTGLDVRLVSYGTVHQAMQAIADRWTSC